MPLTIAAKFYAQMIMIVNKIYNSIIKIKLRKSLDVLQSE